MVGMQALLALMKTIPGFHPLPGLRLPIATGEWMPTRYTRNGSFLNVNY